VLDIVAVIAAQLLYPVLDLTAAVVFCAAVASMSVVGAFLVIRVPANAIGWLLLVAATLLAGVEFSGAYAQASLASAGGTWPATALFAWAGDVLFIPSVIIVAAAVPAVFPDGHLPSPRWRWLPVFLVTGTVLAMLGPAFTPGPISDTFPIENPFAIPALVPFLPLANAVATLTAAPAFVAAFAAVATRYRRGSIVEREQIKWLLADAAVAAAAFSVAFLTSAILPPEAPLANAGILVGFVALAGMPVSIAIAILRYRLFEIDRIVSRTVGWIAVTAILAGIFAGVIVGLQALLAGFTQGQTLAVAGSTLLAFALFQPVRRRVQSVIDRRFNRARYDASTTVDAFAERVRNEVHLGTLSALLASSADLAVRPAGSRVWLRTTRGARR
jgi:hypothetical protein